MDIARYYRKRRKTALIRRAVFTFLFLLFVVGSAWGFFWIPYIRISKLEVVGYDEFDKIEKALAPALDAKNNFFLPLDNFFLFSTKDVAQVLKAADFGVFSIKKKFPRTLLVTFSEKTPWLLFCEDEESCFYVDSEGLIYDYAPKFSSSPLVKLNILGYTSIEMGGLLLKDPLREYLKEALEIFDRLKIEIERLELLLDKNELKSFTDEGWYIYLDLGADLKVVLSDLKLLLDQKIKGKQPELEYIDMRFANKAFYKFR